MVGHLVSSGAYSLVTVASMNLWHEMTTDNLSIGLATNLSIASHALTGSAIHVAVRRRALWCLQVLRCPLRGLRRKPWCRADMV